MWKYRLNRVIFPLVLSVTLLAGCALGKGSESNKNAEPAVLKVMYYDERSFYDQYGMLFSALHPEIEFEVVNTQNVKFEPGKDMTEAMSKFIEEQKPDVLMLSSDQYTKFADQGKLLELDTRIEEKSFGKDDLMPGMLDYLRDLSGGKVYGLVPTFYTQAVYYNKDLFDKYGVAHPKDKMSWDDLLRLAAQFPTTGSKADRVYGLKTGYGGADLYQLASMIGTTKDLSFVNPANMQVTVNTDGWKKTFETAQTALQSGSLYTEQRDDMNGATTYEDHLLGDPFIGGKVAMTMDGNYMMEQIKQAQNVVKDKAIKNWDLVTMPVDPAKPEVTPNMSFDQIMAISAKSVQTDAAWTFLNYIMSDDYARVTSKRQQGMMSVRTKYLKDKEGHHFEAFYALKPVQPAMYKIYEKVPQDFFMSFMGLAQEELKRVSDKQTPLAEALANLQAKAQEALIQAQQKQESKPKEESVKP